MLTPVIRLSARVLLRLPALARAQLDKLPIAKRNVARMLPLMRRPSLLGVLPFFSPLSSLARAGVFYFFATTQKRFPFWASVAEVNPAPSKSAFISCAVRRFMQGTFFSQSIFGSP